jgi:RNA polymerase sigma-70 factor (ECF subfamily)
MNTTLAWNELELVRRAKRGDGRAWQALFQKHRSRITQHVARLVRCHADADDVVQDAFFRAYRGLRAFRGDAAFHTWLYRIATNAALAFLKRSRQREVPMDPEALALLADGCSEQADPERVLAARQAGETAVRALAQLSREQARALALYEDEGRSYAEIARTLGIPINTVRTHIFRARRALQRAAGR